jgi:hypothetical protein
VCVLWCLLPVCLTQKIHSFIQYRPLIHSLFCRVQMILSLLAGRFQGTFCEGLDWLSDLLLEIHLGIKIQNCSVTCPVQSLDNSPKSYGMVDKSASGGIWTQVVLEVEFIWFACTTEPLGHKSFNLTLQCTDKFNYIWFNIQKLHKLRKFNPIFQISI